MSSVTIYDVAAKAGVSIKTVSRVMNNEPNVRPVMRERVLAAAGELGYSPNLSARSLAGSRSFVIAVFVDAALTIDHWQSERGADYLSRIQLGATLVCRDAGYHLLIELIDHEGPQVRQEVAALLAALKPDGVILTPPSSDNAVVLELLDRAGTPYVRVGPERAEGLGPRVHMDDVAAAREMTDHLIGLGHKRIGFIVGEPRYGASQARRDGYLEAMRAKGLSVPEFWVRQGDFTFQSGLEQAKALLALPERPTAIFASNDDMALGAIAAIADAGLMTPGDVSVAGFDDSPSSRFSRPQLTTVRQPVAEMSSVAAKLLIERSRGGASTERPVDELLPFTLIHRASTAPPPR
ncbi:LacI family DNA-binding transcriptional regulator [Caulobacter vibrioides]|uniref:Transcriptional regulator, LacI family n=2 Tax=Caulobacter vibrioides TaxID=155892 RepID=Q9A5Y1_CAUVC|nr:LacI family DNA-binding transcriptional regulator [Caulobacter vibrioides]YP_002517774.1 SalR-family ligand-binding transcriptional regulator [Caulobacter vibrioides NA1000]AAK24287.1 transcriptional regulator, LacI family [Caulobacter vibrioides CB15]ACL95866.1 SalR-family ligand-binding transcriptional regulator [Caulobacter vibrioides NA1000]ATC29179.1 LacI family transcriptional regulator [Caulobacter vibrioides]QXZ50691.1 LacI family DNA-binding transcriptional regulator [Caulobacter v